MDSTFVATDFGDGVVEARGPSEQPDGIPQSVKVQLPWGTAFLNPR